ncbi:MULTISPECIES: hypothetical protein [Sphingobacterium]|uniref:Histidine kinase/DNA gyrase B/HSP90-like ATPase n=2 Tax=Sphingobacterium TaxID=28453 RepID=A0A4R6WEB6_9SPHI|nr:MULTISPECIES: hypothetical protein [Sphingobacterium]TDQ78132.1 hypothetical protein CLV99_2110 [Sphingobacterium yanglingense]
MLNTLKNKNSIRLAICDTGIGLTNCVNNYLLSKGEEIWASEDAIAWAFTLKNTTQSPPRNRGLGLNNLLDETNFHEGEFRMVTYDKWIINNPGVSFKMRDIKCFFGTAIEIEIMIDNLEKLKISDFEYC